MTLDVRLTLRTDDDALLSMTYSGRWVRPPDTADELTGPHRRHLVDPARYCFRTTPCSRPAIPATAG